MTKNVVIYFIGTAGAGKTSLTFSFLNWMVTSGYDAITVNLDPGVEYLEYHPDVDIRDWISLENVMREFNLGPNGAQVAAADMLALSIEEIAKIIDTFETNYILVDTPGQMELFTFRKSSLKVVERLGPDRAVIVFLFDPFIGLTASGFVSQLMMSVTTSLRFNLPLIRVLNKIDMLSTQDVERIGRWSADPECLYADLCDEVQNPHTMLSFNLLRALEDVGFFSPIIPVSAHDLELLHPIYFSIQQLFAAGEDIDR